MESIAKGVDQRPGPQTDSFLGKTSPAEDQWAQEPEGRSPAAGEATVPPCCPGNYSYLTESLQITLLTTSMPTTCLAPEKQGNAAFWRLRLQAVLPDGRTVASLLSKDAGTQ